LNLNIKHRYLSSFSIQTTVVIMNTISKARVGAAKVRTSRQDNYIHGKLNTKINEMK